MLTNMDLVECVETETETYHASGHTNEALVCENLTDRGQKTTNADVHHVETTGDNITGSGCVRSCADTKWHRKMRKKLAQGGLRPVARQVIEELKYGDGELLPATTSYLYPVGMVGEKGSPSCSGRG